MSGVNLTFSSRLSIIDDDVFKAAENATNATSPLTPEGIVNVPGADRTLMDNTGNGDSADDVFMSDFPMAVTVVSAALALILAALVILAVVKTLKKRRDDDDESVDDFDYNAMYESDERPLETNAIHVGKVARHVAKELVRKRSFNLSRVALPAFLMERRSTIEMLADMVSAEMMVVIPNSEDKWQRMLAAVRFYLASIYKMRGENNDSARKPYNPVLGEMFRCVKEPRTLTPPPSCKMDYSAEPSDETTAKINSLPADDRARYQSAVNHGMLHSDPANVRFIGEQVSHHPPITAFYADSVGNGVSLRGTFEIACKFDLFRARVRVEHRGKFVLVVVDHRNGGEWYAMTLPDAHVTNILNGHAAVNFVGQAKIESSTGFHATAKFPSASSKDDRFGVSVRFEHSDTVVSGKWRGKTFLDDGEEFLDARHLHQTSTLCQPVERQSWNESKRLWKEVTRALREEKFEKADEEKQTIEEKQRDNEEDNQEPKLFSQKSDKIMKCPAEIEWMFKGAR